MQDKRCRRTRAALEKALYEFYAHHSHFEKVPIVRLCKKARISTSTFYRHYKGVHDLVRSRDRKISARLRRKIGDDSLLISGLVRAFNFVRENNSYYLTNFLQQYEKPFENLARILEPKILNFIRTERKTRRALKIDQRICIEIKTL